MPAVTFDSVQALERVALLDGIRGRDLERLARLFRERTFPQGSAVTAEGEPGIGFFVITGGSADVSVGGELRTTLGSGDSFGELALIDEGPRTATIVAASELRCLALSAWDFKPFVEEHPTVAWALLQTLARRIRELEAM
jgi:CRP/FNR family cyclic AMP-dependent transcriptional regulator